MFAYCGNNPVNHVDPTGHAISTVTLGVIAAVCVDAVIDGAVSAFTEYITGGSNEDVSKAFYSATVFSLAVSAIGCYYPDIDTDTVLKSYALYQGSKAYFSCRENGANRQEGLFVGLLTFLTNLPYSNVNDAAVRRVAELVFGTGSSAITTVVEKYYSGTYFSKTALSGVPITPGPHLSGKGVASGCGSSIVVYTFYE